jgi:hypothetical protein
MDDEMDQMLRIGSNNPAITVPSSQIYEQSRRQSNKVRGLMFQTQPAIRPREHKIRIWTRFNVSPSMTLAGEEWFETLVHRMMPYHCLRVSLVTNS